MLPNPATWEEINLLLQFFSTPWSRPEAAVGEKGNLTLASIADPQENSPQAHAKTPSISPISGSSWLTNEG